MNLEHLCSQTCIKTSSNVANEAAINQMSLVNEG